MAAAIASVIIGIITTFLQITGVITITSVFLWITFVIAVAYLAVLFATASSAQGTAISVCVSSALNTLLIGILETILFTSILLAVGIVATSSLSAVLSGLLLIFFSLMLSSSACYVKYLIDAGS